MEMSHGDSFEEKNQNNFFIKKLEKNGLFFFGRFKEGSSKTVDRDLMSIRVTTTLIKVIIEKNTVFMGVGLP